ncbi:MAG: hypothetical protein HYY11_06950 [Candidatus Methylomirabilis oxyfera]|nr:hypothetical protein [Candidatus Methylomirabilis oxyfera]
MGRALPDRLGFYDPFSGLPMLWNPETGQLYNVGKDEKDDSGDVTLDIAVQITTTHLPSGESTGGGVTEEAECRGGRQRKN